LFPLAPRDHHAHDRGTDALDDADDGVRVRIEKLGILERSLGGEVAAARLRGLCRRRHRQRGRPAARIIDERCGRAWRVVSSSRTRIPILGR
jgi:hypothetical protein